MKAVLTKVNVQQGSIGSLHQDFLTGTSQSFIHKVHAVGHQRAQSFSIFLKINGANLLRSSFNGLFKVYKYVYMTLRRKKYTVLS